MPKPAYTLDCPTETDPPEGTALLHGTRLGPGTYPIDGPDGPYRIVVSENTVVTVLAP